MDVWAIIDGLALIVGIIIPSDGLTSGKHCVKYVKCGIP
jgi:hypothetical protein